MQEKNLQGQSKAPTAALYTHSAPLRPKSENRCVPPNAICRKHGRRTVTDELMSASRKQARASKFLVKLFFFTSKSNSCFKVISGYLSYFST